MREKRWCIRWSKTAHTPAGRSSSDTNKELLEDIAALLNMTHTDKDYWVDEATEDPAPAEDPVPRGLFDNQDPPENEN